MVAQHSMPSRLPRSWSLTLVRNLLLFGLRFQTVGLVVLLRDQGLNLLIAARGGAAALGLYALAYSVVQLPNLLLDGLYRLSFPAMSRVHRSGGQLGSAGKQMVEPLQIALNALIVITVAAATALSGSLLGEEWRTAIQALPVMCVGLVVVGPLGVGLSGVLQSTDRSMQLGFGIASGGAVRALILLALLTPASPMAAAWGFLCGSIVEAAVLAVTAQDIVAPRCWATVVDSSPSAASGWWRRPQPAAPSLARRYSWPRLPQSVR